MDAARKIFAAEGIRSFFKGAGANILRGVAGAGVLSIYDRTYFSLPLQRAHLILCRGPTSFVRQGLQGRLRLNDLYSYEDNTKGDERRRSGAAVGSECGEVRVSVRGGEEDESGAEKDCCGHNANRKGNRLRKAEETMVLGLDSFPTNIMQGVLKDDEKGWKGSRTRLYFNICCLAPQVISMKCNLNFIVPPKPCLEFLFTAVSLMFQGDDLETLWSF